MRPHRKLHWTTWKDRLNALKNLPPVLVLVHQSCPSLIAVALGLRLLVALLPVTTLWIAKRIVDLIVSSVQQHSTSIPIGLWFLLAAEFMAAACGLLIGRCMDYCDSRIADRVSKALGLRVMEHAATLDLVSFEDPAFYDKLERARAQAVDRVAMLNALGSLFQQAVTLVSLSIGILCFSPLLYALLVVSVLPSFLGESYFALLGYTLAYSLTSLRRELDYLRDLCTKKEGAKEVKVFGLSGLLCDRFSGVYDEIIHRNGLLAGRRLRAGSLLAVFASLGYYVAYAILVVKTFNGDLTVGSLTFLAGGLAGCSTQIQLFLSSFAHISDHALFLTDLVYFLAMKPKIGRSARAIPAPRPMRDGFEFRNVSFAYPESNRIVLDRINCRIEAGERIALVGENGQGKTTLVKLITRLYEPTSGQILLDGIDLREYDLTDLRQMIGVIFQDFLRFDWTVRENIAVGAIEHAGDTERVLQAAGKSGSEQLIHRFPHGLEQMLGRRFEDGVDLSGGEWQKLALARTYMRDAGVLILDEPTAALDPIAEYDVFQRFADLTEGKTAILISHRFSTVRMADRIMVLHNGKLHEEGTHQQLMARQGRYANMFARQAESYRCS